MKAAVTTRWEQIELQDLPTPQPRPGQLRLRPRLAGICGSDVHIFQGHHPTAKAPVVQGHEVVAVVDAIGPDTPTTLQTGDRVVVEPLISCGLCEACRRGHMHVCRKLGLLGIHTNGAFAQYMLADARKAVRVPDGLDDHLAVLAEPFAVGVHVCARAQVAAGERALIIGAGPIGLIIAIVASFSGARVSLSEVNPDRIERARAMGFTVIDATADAAAQADAITETDGFDVVFEVSGSQPGVLLAAQVTRVRGRIVQVGFFGTTPPQVDLMKLIFKELSIVGSRVYTYEDFTRTVAVLAAIAKEGRFPLRDLITDRTNLAGVQAGIEQMIRGKAAGKLIVEIDS